MRYAAGTRPFAQPLVQHGRANPHARTRTEQRFALPCGDFATANDKHGTIGQVGEQWIQLHRAAISGD